MTGWPAAKVWRLKAAIVVCCGLVGGSRLLSQTGALPDSPSPIPRGEPQVAPMVEMFQESATVMTLDDAIHIATSHNPQYQTALLQAKQNLELYKAQRTQYFPTLYTFALYDEALSRFNFTFPVGTFGTFPGTGPIPGADTTYSTPRKPFSLGAGYASQPLTGLIRLHYSVNSQRLTAVSMGFRAEVTRQQQITIVKQAYTRLRNSEEQAEASVAAVRAAQETDRVAHARRDQGELLLSQVQAADASLANAESQAQQDIDQVAQNKERLNLAVGRDALTSFKSEPVSDRRSLHDLSDEALRSLALANRPELKQDDASIRANQLQVRATRAMYIPDVSASGEYLGLLTNSYGLPSNTGVAGLQLAWEPWDWGRKKHQSEAQQAIVQQSQVQLSQDQNQIVADVNQATRTYRQREAQLRAMTISAQATRTNLLEVQEQVKNGTALVAMLLQAQAADATAVSQLATAHNNVHDAEAQLEQAVGEVQ